MNLQEKRTGFYVKVFSCLLVSMFFIAFQTFVQENKTQKALGGSGANSGPGKSSIAFNGGNVKIKYPESVQSSETKVESELLFMGKPSEFEQDGIYIWRDNELLWNVCCKGASPFSMQIEIISTFDYDIIDIIGDEVAVNSDGNRSFTISGMANESLQVVRFKAAEEFLDFSILIDGKHIPDQVFLGAQCRNPEVQMFRLENLDMTSISGENLQITKIPNQSKIDKASEKSIALPKQAKGGGGGGKGTGGGVKVKKK